MLFPAMLSAWPHSSLWRLHHLISCRAALDLGLLPLPTAAFFQSRSKQARSTPEKLLSYDSSVGSRVVALVGDMYPGSVEKAKPEQNNETSPSFPRPGLLSDTTSFSLVIHSCSPARTQSQTSQQRQLKCPCSHIPLYPLSCSRWKGSAQLPEEKQ